ncbi:MAG: hypothetical protein WAL94_09205 [Bacteroidales bacterium]
MKQIVLRDKGQEFVLKSVFILTVISLGLQLITTDPHSLIFWVVAVLFIMLIVLLIITRGLKTTANSLTLEDGNLIIRWYSRIRKRTINVLDIVEIRDEKKFISIKLINDKVIRIPVRFLDVKEHREIQNFLKEITEL